MPRVAIRQPLSVAGSSGGLALVQGLAEHGLITAWRLMFSSLAAASSSSSMDAVKSTLTRWMGFIILPELVKKWETSLPLSARRAIA
jgi:hypothetical protein